MRKVGIIISFVLTVFQLSAQEGFKLGVQAGLPLNEFNDAVSVVLGADASYMYPLGEVVDIGPAVGYIHGFAEKYQSTIALSDLEAVQFLPLSVGVRFWTSNSFSFGGNAGWAMGINDGNDGGVYYRPTIAYLTSSSSEVNLSYTNINLDQAKWTTITLGLVYNFEPKYRTRR